MKESLKNNSSETSGYYSIACDEYMEETLDIVSLRYLLMQNICV